MAATTRFMATLSTTRVLGRPHDDGVSGEEALAQRPEPVVDGAPAGPQAGMAAAAIADLLAGSVDPLHLGARIAAAFGYPPKQGGRVPGRARAPVKDHDQRDPGQPAGLWKNISCSTHRTTPPGAATPPSGRAQAERGRASLDRR